MTLQEKILDHLRKEAGEVSGEALSKKLKVSRTAVWKQIERLRQEGYSIESSTKRGYRLTQEIDKLNETEILSAAKGSVIPLHLEILPETASTNADAFERGRDGAPEGTVVFAERQSAGRGRLGRAWESPAFKNLYLSVLLRPELPPSKVSPLTLIAGLAVYDSLLPFLKEGLKLKWPNDLWVRSKKLAGILTEMEAEQDKVHFVVVGLGLNVHAREADFSKALAPSATSLAIENVTPPSRSRLAGLFLSSFFKYYRAFLKQGFAPFREKWETDSQMKGKKVRVQEVGKTYEGVCEGLDASGCLLVKTSRGTEPVLAGDVSWI